MIWGVYSTIAQFTWEETVKPILKVFAAATTHYNIILYSVKLDWICYAHFHNVVWSGTAWKYTRQNWRRTTL